MAHEGDVEPADRLDTCFVPIPAYILICGCFQAMPLPGRDRRIPAIQVLALLDFNKHEKTRPRDDKINLAPRAAPALFQKRVSLLQVGSQDNLFRCPPRGVAGTATPLPTPPPGN